LCEEGLERRGPADHRVALDGDGNSALGRARGVEHDKERRSLHGDDLPPRLCHQFGF